MGARPFLQSAAAEIYHRAIPRIIKNERDVNLMDHIEIQYVPASTYEKIGFDNTNALRLLSEDTMISVYKTIAPERKIKRTIPSSAIYHKDVQAKKWLRAQIFRVIMRKNCMCILYFKLILFVY